MQQIPESLIEKKIKSINRHWYTNKVDEEIIQLKKRQYFQLLFPLVIKFDVQRAVVLMGPRRVGKTVMLFQTIQECLDKKMISKNLVYFSMDEPLFYSLSLDDLLNKYKKVTGEKSLKNKIIIFDEIQYLKKWDVQLKVLVDNYQKTKFIVSGSAAGALRRYSRESGAGRFTDFMLPPLTFYEYLNLLDLTDSLLTLDSDTKKAISSKDIRALNEEFINYLNYGGFPEAIVNKSIRLNPDKFIRQDIIEKVLLRDLPSLYGISDIQELNKLFNYLAYHTGNEINYEGLSQSSGVAKNTIKKYIEYLEAAFLIKRISRINEKGKAFKRDYYFKVYLTNPSMYSAIYGLTELSDHDSLGKLVETAICSQWIHNQSLFSYLHYARLSQGKGEVDIVRLDRNFKVKHCLEIKWSDQFYNRPKNLKSLIYFCKKNNPNHVTVTTKTKTGDIIQDGVHIHFKEAAIVCYNVGLNQILKSKEGELI